MAVGTLGQLRAVHVTPANEQEREQVRALCEQVQQATGQTVNTAWADQGCTGAQAQKAVKGNDIDFQIVKLSEAKKGFMLLPRRWVVESSFGWLGFADFPKYSWSYIFWCFLCSFCVPSHSLWKSVRRP